ncbi:MAG: competence/damage-inducible protein A [Campylobacterales bacterium]|nr:competence/damage-inducible protein A [Campylobacterales bacterium]
MESPHFYAVIIGSEILNARREDKHFAFIRDALLRRGHTLFFTCTIKDDEALMTTLYTMIKNDPKAVMFSFGGIGSTPDDLTRAVASKVFGDGVLYAHPAFRASIVERFAEAAFPHRVLMADLPKEAGLLHNVVNNMSGFYLQERYFFMPGFPQMAHPMVEEALDRFYPVASTPTYRATLLADTSENTLIDVMRSIPPHLELSSLPILNPQKPQVEISVSGSDAQEVEAALGLFEAKLKMLHIPYRR